MSSRRLSPHRFALIFALLAVLPLSSPSFGEAAPVGSEFQINTATADHQDVPTVALTPGGDFVVVWESYGQDGSGEGIFLQRFASDGAPIGAEMQVNTYTAADQTDPDIALLGGGGFVVVWDSEYQDGSAGGIFGRLYDSGGNAIGGELEINLQTIADQNDAVVAAAADGGFLVAWETDLGGPVQVDLMAQRFDSSGVHIGSEIQLNTTITADQEDLDLASDAAGNFIVVWESDGQDGSADAIVGRRLDSAGQPIGAEFLVNTFTSGDQDDPDVAMAADGSFVVVWEDDTQNSFDDGIYARFYDAAAVAVTDPFQVETEATFQLNPRVALDALGRATVIWDSYLQDGSYGGIYRRTFDTAGQPLTDEEQVNTTTADDQYDPHLAIGSGGVCVAVWTSDGGQDGSGRGVFAQRYAPAEIFADGFETGDAAAWSAKLP